MKGEVRKNFMDGYDTVDEMIVWDAVEKHLPLFISETQKLLNR